MEEKKKRITPILIGLGAATLAAIAIVSALKKKEEPEPPPGPCEEGSTQTKVCPDGSTIITHNCVNGEWVETGNTCPNGEVNAQIINVNTT